MSTVSVTNVKNASSSVNNAVTTSGGDLTNAAGVSFMSANKNLLYNGACQIAQRSTSVASITTDGYYTADRWKTLFVNGVGTWTQTIENDAPTGSGFQKSLKMLCTTAKSVVTTDLLGVTQQLEGQDLQRIAKGTASAQQLTLSFWVKSNVTGTYIAYLYDDTNARHVAASYTISASATWERKTVTFPADTTGAFANTNASALYVFFHLAAGASLQSGTLATSWASYTAANRAVGQVNVAAATNNYWQVTGMQLEIGAVATSFEFKSYGQELRECQRYYYRMTPGSTYYRYAIGSSENASSFNVVVPHPVTMRVGPTSIQTTGTASDYIIYEAGNFRTCTAAPTIAAATSFSTCLNSTATSLLTAGRAGEFLAANATSYVGLSAEL